MEMYSEESVKRVSATDARDLLIASRIVSDRDPELSKTLEEESDVLQAHLDHVGFFTARMRFGGGGIVDKGMLSEREQVRHLVIDVSNRMYPQNNAEHMNGWSGFEDGAMYAYDNPGATVSSDSSCVPDGFYSYLGSDEAGVWVRELRESAFVRGFFWMKKHLASVDVSGGYDA